MPPRQHKVRRLVVIAGLAVAATGPIAALAAPSTAAASCPAGEDNDTYTGTCIPYLVPNSRGAATLCPPGVGGTECGSAQVPPAAPPPVAVAPQQPEQELEDVSTPDF